MSETTPSPTSIPANSSTQFANEPLLALMKKPLHKMSQDELRAYTLEMRTLAKSPQALGRKLRKEQVEEDEDEAPGVQSDGSVVLPGTKSRATKAKPVKTAAASFDDLLKEMGG